MATALISDSRFALHDEPNHPEQQQRLASLHQRLRDPRLALLQHLPLRAATEREIGAVHQWPMQEEIQTLAYEGGGWLNADTYVTSDSWRVATLAAGGAITAVEAVVQGTVNNAFALLRPPGHHATPSQAMGFCLVNNIAVAARYALDHLGVRRLAIVDWDVHHGNGTQDIFYGDERVLFCSTHAYPFYPGTGHWREMGSGQGYGTTLNVPLPLDSGDAVFVQVYDELILPAVRRFGPDLILVSAGYDSHWADPLGRLRVSTTGYATVATKVYNLAAELCHGRIVCILEGGYHPDALAECVVATLGILSAQPDLIEDTLGQHDDPPIIVDPLIRQIQHQHPSLMTY